MKTKHRFKGYVVVVSIILLFILLQSYLPTIRQFASPEFIREYLLTLGNWGYLAYVIIFLLSIPLPIPSTPVAIAGGYVYGIILGTVLTMVAAIIGASIAFFLIRKYGEPLLQKMVSRKHIEHFNHIFQRRGINGAILAYAIPVFPSDSINFILGLSNMRFHTFLFVTIVGNIPRYVLVNALGQELFTGFSVKTIIVPLLTTLYLLIAIFREKVKGLLFKELKELEGEVKVIEKDVERDVEWVEEEVGWKKKPQKKRKKTTMTFPHRKEENHVRRRTRKNA